jgi:hypothetical protein
MILLKLGDMSIWVDNICISVILLIEELILAYLFNIFGLLCGYWNLSFILLFWLFITSVMVSYCSS